MLRRDELWDFGLHNRFLNKFPDALWNFSRTFYPKYETLLPEHACGTATIHFYDLFLQIVMCSDEVVLPFKVLKLRVIFKPRQAQCLGQD